MAGGEFPSRLQQPMKRYNFDEIVDRRESSSLKYEACRACSNPWLPEDHIPMWVADMDFACPQPMLDAMKRRLDRRILGYSIHLPDNYYEAVIRWLRRRHGIEVTRDNISFSTSVIDSARQAIHWFTQVGDGVILHTPGYAHLHSPILDLDRRPVLLPLREEDGWYSFDYEELEQQAKKPENKLFMLCSPHNPSGRVWTEEELRRVAEICFANDMAIFCDEIHHDLTRCGVKTISLTALYPGDPRIVTAISTSKTFNTAGNNHSYVLVYDHAAKLAYDDSIYCGAPNPLSIEAVIAAYEECEDWVDELRAYLDENFRTLKEFIDENLPCARFRIPEGTYLAWVDLRAYGLSDAELFHRISAAGLLLEYSEDFIQDGTGFVRLNLACPRETVRQACLRLKEALSYPQKKKGS